MSQADQADVIAQLLLRVSQLESSLPSSTPSTTPSTTDPSASEGWSTVPAKSSTTSPLIPYSVASAVTNTALNLNLLYDSSDEEPEKTKSSIFGNKPSPTKSSHQLKHVKPPTPPTQATFILSSLTRDHSLASHSINTASSTGGSVNSANYTFSPPNPPDLVEFRSFSPHIAEGLRNRRQRCGSNNSKKPTVKPPPILSMLQNASLFGSASFGSASFGEALTKKVLTPPHLTTTGTAMTQQVKTKPPLNAGEAGARGAAGAREAGAREAGAREAREARAREARAMRSAVWTRTASSEVGLEARHASKLRASREQTARFT